MSLRSSLWRYLGLLAVAALAVGVFAGPASAKMSHSKMTAKQRAHVRKQLRKQIKHNPKLIRKKSFVKRAALVNFRLPVTIRLRGGNDAANNPNSATIDLGASLGQREIDLGGKLAAEIVFHDTFDGGALGNVDVDIRPSDTKTLTTTSIPLLWNSDVTGQTRANGGCQEYLGDPAQPAWYDDILSPAPGNPVLNPAPFQGSASGGAYPSPGFPSVRGYDSLAVISANKDVGNPFSLGGNPNPFPGGGPISTPGVADTVLRTAPLNLAVPAAGTTVTGFVPDNNSGDNSQGNTPVQNSQNIVVGRSGGQANLFGNIPGKSYGIDVTVNLKAKIFSILRMVDAGTPTLIAGNSWPAEALNCRQGYTGYVQNYIPGVRLQGSLKISPAILPDGKLRIAKATISSGGQERSNIALAACLFPHETLVTSGATVPPAQGGPYPDSDTVSVTVPTPPINPGAPRSAPTDVPCNSPANQLAQDANVTTLDPASTANGYTVGNDGSKAVVAGALSVTNVSADILIGDV